MTPLRSGLRVRFCELLDESSAEPKRDDSKNSKRAINQSPAERDSSDASHHQRERHDERASNHSELDNPNVFHRVAQRPDERDGDDEVRERQPVRSVSDEWILGVGCNERVTHLEQPADEAAVFRVVVSPGNSRKQLEFGFQRDGRCTADDQPNDEQEKEQPDSIEERCGHKLTPQRAAKSKARLNRGRQLNR